MMVDVRASPTRIYNVQSSMYLGFSVMAEQNSYDIDQGHQRRSRTSAPKHGIEVNLLGKNKSTLVYKSTLL
jgi:hypothetical protein